MGWETALQVSLLACANNDPSHGAAMPPSYVLFGAACSEVEINLLTGETRCFCHHPA